MSERGSYNIENFSVDKSREMLRLNAQVDLFWEQEHSLYKRLGLKDGMAVLDCGCGSGYLLEKLHTLYPSMVCTGIEISDFLFISASNAIISKKLTRCHVYKQSILKTDLPDNAFDFVVVRLVMEHLPDPLTAMREVSRVLKVGGRAVFVDNDFDYHVRSSPEVPELVQMYDAYCTARSRDGGNPRIGRQLPQLLSLAGFINISFDVIAANNTITGDKAFHHSEGSGIALQLLHDGYLSSDVYDRLASHWSSMLQTRGHSMIRLLFAGSGEKRCSTHGKSTDENYCSSTDSAESFSTGVQSDNLSTKESSSSLTGTIAQILETTPDKLDLEQPLGDLGLDSVGSVMLKNHIENEMNVSVPSLDYFHSHTVNDIITFLQDRITTPLNKDTHSNSNGFEEGEI